MSTTTTARRSFATSTSTAALRARFEEGQHGLAQDSVITDQYGFDLDNVTSSR